MRNNRGFTLLEMVIGLTVLGFIMALAFSGFRLASTSWDAVTNKAEAAASEQLTRSLLRRLITQIQPLHWKKTVGQPITFSGTADRLAAIVPMSGQMGAGGLVVIELAARRTDSSEIGGNQLKLELRRAPLRYQDEAFFDTLAESSKHLLLEDLQEVEFSYFGVQQPGAEPGWQSTWDNTTQLPKLVRLHLRSADEGWTDLIVAPMIAGTNCRWDSFYKRCM